MKSYSFDTDFLSNVITIKKKTNAALSSSGTYNNTYLNITASVSDSNRTVTVQSLNLLQLLVF